MVRNIVIAALHEVNKDRANLSLDDIDEDFEIFNNLDSMDVLNLIIEIENHLSKSFNKYIQIADESSMDMTSTPFKTFGTLVNFIENKIQDI